ncbi:hypothetical protein ACJX0J_029989, partial [Zea mays]
MLGALISIVFDIMDATHVISYYVILPIMAMWLLSLFIVGACGTPHPHILSYLNEGTYWNTISCIFQVTLLIGIFLHDIYMGFQSTSLSVFPIIVMEKLSVLGTTRLVLVWVTIPTIYVYVLLVFDAIDLWEFLFIWDEHTYHTIVWCLLVIQNLFFVYVIHENSKKIKVTSYAQVLSTTYIEKLLFVQQS